MARDILKPYYQINKYYQSISNGSMHLTIYNEPKYYLTIAFNEASDSLVLIVLDTIESIDANTHRLYSNKQYTSNSIYRNFEIYMLTQFYLPNCV